jgi:hypothetical protein
MSHKRLKALVGCALASVQWLVPPSASAVGNGLPFVFREGLVQGAMAHPVAADSLDFTYHACVHFTDDDTFRESGYFWISSFQDLDSEVDSQINYFLANGYRIYGLYTFEADQWGQSQPTPSGNRLNYVVSKAKLSLFLDWDQNTVLGINNCLPGGNTDGDVFLGTCDGIISGEKSETDGQANGDFDILFEDWMFSPAGATLFRNPADPANLPLVVNQLVFNGNVTLLNGALGDDHMPEGSGNLYWID